MSGLLALFAGHGLKFAAIFGLLAMVGTWDWRRIKAAENRGGELVRVETGKANDAAVRIGTSAARKSITPGMQTVRRRDPSTRDD